MPLDSFHIINLHPLGINFLNFTLTSHNIRNPVLILLLDSPCVLLLYATDFLTILVQVNMIASCNSCRVSQQYILAANLLFYYIMQGVLLDTDLVTRKANEVH